MDKNTISIATEAIENMSRLTNDCLNIYQTMKTITIIMIMVNIKIKKQIIIQIIIFVMVIHHMVMVVHRHSYHYLHGHSHWHSIFGTSNNTNAGGIGDVHNNNGESNNASYSGPTRGSNQYDHGCCQWWKY